MRGPGGAGRGRSATATVGERGAMQRGGSRFRRSPSLSQLRGLHGLHGLYPLPLALPALPLPGSPRGSAPSAVTTRPDSARQRGTAAPPGTLSASPAWPGPSRGDCNLHQQLGKRVRRQGRHVPITNSILKSVSASLGKLLGCTPYGALRGPWMQRAEKLHLPPPRFSYDEPPADIARKDARRACMEDSKTSDALSVTLHGFFLKIFHPISRWAC